MVIRLVSIFKTSSLVDGVDVSAGTLDFKTGFTPELSPIPGKRSGVRSACDSRAFDSEYSESFVSRLDVEGVGVGVTLLPDCAETNPPSMHNSNGATNKYFI